MATNEVYDEYKVIDKSFSLVEEYWSNIIDATAGAAKEFSLLRAKDVYKGSAQERLAIDQSVKIFKDASQRAIEFADKADRLGGQDKEGLKKLFENVSKIFSEQAKSIKNSESFHRDLKQTKATYISEKHWKLAAKGADKLGPAATFIDLGIRASKGNFSGVASGALGAVAGLAFIAMLGATGGWAIPVAILAAGIGLETDKRLKKFFDYMIFDYLGLGHVDDQVNDNFNNAHGFAPSIDPLAIDLNGDGVQTISIDSGVLFDFNDDQIRTGTGWLDASDGFLVYDRNNNGFIDNGGELFGVDTRKTDGSLATDGFDALRDLDSNGDGIFNAEDDGFSKVKIWQDKNSDGISQSDELSTLDELGIMAINLDSQATNIDSNGNRIAATGTVEFADGSTRTAANLDLSSNPFYREFTDTVEISEDIASLPDMQGSGAVRDLRQAASQNAELAELLAQYSGLKTYAEQRTLLDNLVSAWAKSSGYTHLFDRLEKLSSGQNGEAKAAFMPSWLMQLREPNASELAQQSLLEKIAILEVFNGRDFYNFTLQDNGSLHISAGSNVSSTIKPPSGKDVIVTEAHLAPNPEQAALLDKAYQQLLDSVYEALLPQTRLKPYLDAVSLQWNGTDFEFDYSKVIQQLNAASQNDAVETVLLGFELKQLLSDPVFDQLFKTERPKWISSLDSAQLIELNKYLGSEWLSIENEPIDNKSLLIGTSGNDTIYGGSYHNNELYGGEGDDTLIARPYAEESLLAGGKGNDTLYGGYGSDTYLFNLGDGQDQIIEQGDYFINSMDTLRFGEGIRPEDMSMHRDGSDFLFIHKNGSDQVSIKNIFSYYPNWDGNWINDNQVVEQITFADGIVWNWDEIVSHGIISRINSNNGIFDGLLLNDIIYGSKSDDVINGHGGDDVIYGEDGNDILDGGMGSNQLYGGAGDDILKVDEKYSNNNVLAGGTGNDILYGSYSDDTYLFNLGDGQDQIIEPDRNDNNGFDTLQFGESIRPEDISIRWEGNDLLFIHSNGNDQVLIKDVFFNYPHWNGSWINDEKIIEQITFADGTTWHWGQVILQGAIIHANTNNSDISHGLEDDDIIYDGEENHIIDGGAGDNVPRMDDSSEDNLLIGGKGDDILYGSRNADTYIFNLGDGKDQIFEQGSYYNNAIDSLRFGAGIKHEDIKIQRDGSDFLFIHTNGTDQVRIKNVFNDAGWINSDKIVEKVTFTDGTVWHWDQLVLQGTVLHAIADGSILHGLQGNDIIYGNTGNDILYGHEGDDIIYGGDGNDIIDGGEGSNQLYGGAGNDILKVDSYSDNNLLIGGTGNDILFGSYYLDTYVFNLGDGQDQIFNPGDYYSNPEDILRFGEGIRPEDISMRREGDDFLFLHNNGRDQILIKNIFAVYPSYYSELFNSWVNSGGMINQVTFADGTVWDWKQLKQNAIIGHATDDGTWLKGWDGKDILYGSIGDDEIYGLGGNDIIYGGDGNDYIDGGTGNNQLYGGDGDDTLIVDIQSRNNILAGGTGNDTLQGSFYTDTYLFNRGDRQDSIIEHGYDHYRSEVSLDDEENIVSHGAADDYPNGENEWKWANENNSWRQLSNDQAIDKLVFGEGISAKDLWFEQQDQHLIVKIIGAEDQVLIENWYEGKGFRIEEFHTADGRILLEAEVNKMVQAMAAFAPLTGSESNLTAIPREQLDSIIAVHWQ